MVIVRSRPGVNQSPAWDRSQARTPEAEPTAAAAVAAHWTHMGRS
jgi:hypothetical protein